MYNFSSTTSLDELFHKYIIDHLVWYPGVTVGIALLSILFIRIRGRAIIIGMIGKKTKHYDRFNYLTLKWLIFGSLFLVVVSVIVGVALNADLAPQLSKTIDRTYYAGNQTVDVVTDLEKTLDTLANTTSIGINGSAIARGYQDGIIADIDNITASLIKMNTSVNAFAGGFIASAAAFSVRSRSILTSLQGYPQLGKIPAVDDVPIIDENKINSQLAVTNTATQEAIKQLSSIRAQVADLSIDIDLSGATDAINDALDDVRSLVQSVVDDILETKPDVQEESSHYNTIRMSILFVTYVVPLLCVSVGVLDVIIRANNVAAWWFHVLLFGAGFSAVCAGIYMVVPVAVHDVCTAQQSAILMGVNLFDKDNAPQMYNYIVKYFPVIQKCDEHTYLIDYVDLPGNISQLLNQSTDINFALGTNYSSLLDTATAQLDAGIVNLNNMSIALINSTDTKSKLNAISLKASNLSNFNNYSQDAYDATVNNINDQTKNIPVTYPNGTQATYAIFYVASNVSLIDLNAEPYLYTSDQYKQKLNGSVQAFDKVNDTYTQALETSHQITQNITVLEAMIDSMDNASANFDQVKAEANQIKLQVHEEAANASGIINSLTGTAINQIIPQLDIVNRLWNNAANATNCAYLGDAYRNAEHFFCYTVLVSSVAYVLSHLICCFLMILLSFAAIYGSISFRRAYKPFLTDEPAVAMLPIASAAKMQMEDEQYVYLDKDKDKEKKSRQSKTKKKSNVVYGVL